MIFEETVYDERNGLDTISLALKDLYVNFIIAFFLGHILCVYLSKIHVLYFISILGTFSWIIIIVHSYITISATIVAQLMILDATKASRLQCSEDQLVGSCLLANVKHFNSAFVVQWYWSHVLNYILYHSFQSNSINSICG